MASKKSQALRLGTLISVLNLLLELWLDRVKLKLRLDFNELLPRRRREKFLAARVRAFGFTTHSFSCLSAVRLGIAAKG